MMKRPRSFIWALFLSGTLALPAAVVLTASTPTDAGGLTRLMNPRAGDPDEPDPSINKSVIVDEDLSTYEIAPIAVAVHSRSQSPSWTTFLWSAWRWYVR
jgi:hypothetical protein